jgi:hypothetical protein
MHANSVLFAFDAQQHCLIFFADWVFRLKFVPQISDDFIETSNGAPIPTIHYVVGPTPAKKSSHQIIRIPVHKFGKP